ncbi:MAG: hypothetical protein HY520_02625 [Candidatus Aenigmarchaeota archaeon]|nr:hypothetical protein [Candidatus Aenigmarchaeota archaeon]
MAFAPARHVLVAIVFLLGLALAFSLSPTGMLPATFAESSPNVTVNVTISSFADLTIIPANYTVTGINPGADNAPLNFTIRNTGSTNITNIHAFPDTTDIERASPLDSGNSLFYASTGFIFITNESRTNYSHLGRLEWNLSDNLVSENLNLAGNPANRTFGRGWYRNASNTFLWKVENGTGYDGTGGPVGSACNSTSTLFSIKAHAENSTSGLSRDFAVGAIHTGTFVTGIKDWGLHRITTGPLNEYCVATYFNCSKIYVYKYDKRTNPNFDACTNSRYLRVATLFPGDESFFELFTSVPQGIPSGATTGGKLTISGS